MAAQGGGDLQRQVDRLSAKVGAAQEARDRQADSIDLTLTVVTIFIGGVALVVTVGAIVATVIGYRVVRHYVENEMAARISENVERTGREVFESQADGLRDKYDARLAELFDRFERTTGGT